MEGADKPQIRGRDLVGGIQVMPLGLDVAIKKRTSGEFKTELHGGDQKFTQVSSLESTASSKQSKSFQQSTRQSSSSTSHQQFSSNFSANHSSTSEEKLTKESSSWAQQQNKQQSFANISTSKTKDLGFEAVSGQFGQEIQQNELKNKIESVITDLEQDKEFVDFSATKAMTLTSNGSPAQAFSPTPFLSNQQKQASLEMFSPPPLEPFEPPSSLMPVKSGSPPPQRSTAISDFSESCYKQTSSSASKIKETTQFVMNGGYQQEEVAVNQQVSQLAHVMNGGLQQEAGELSNSSSSSLLQKIMTPAQVDVDRGSLKRRDPKKMFSDSSFYNSDKHPTVADQVELAQKISKAMFSKDNKMFQNKAQSAVDGNVVHAGAIPEDLSNLKLIMNPEGKVHEWNDIPADQQPNADLLAGHAHAAESGLGGELFAKRREKADNWVVDESSIGKKMPSAFADQFVQEQTIQQQRVMENKMHEEHQRQQTIQQQSAIELEQRQEQQQFSQQQFAAQQQMKQEQSLELRKQQEIRVSQSEVELPNNLKRTDLKNRGCSTPGIDLGYSCHNTQGINVWANTAPRGWGTLKRESRQAASSSYESSLQLQMQSDLQRTQNEFEQNEREERMFLEKQQESLRCQREEEESFMIQQQQEQLKIQKEHEGIILAQQQQQQQRIQQEQQQMLLIQQEQLKNQKEEQEMILYQQQQEKIRVQREEEMLLIQQQQEQMRMQKEQEERMFIKQQQHEQMIKQKEQEERMFIQQQQQEQMRMQKEQEERMFIQQQQQEQMRIQKEQEEKMFIQQQQQEQLRLEKEQEEKMRYQQEQIRIQQEQEQIRLRKEQEEFILQQQKQQQFEMEQNEKKVQQQKQGNTQQLLQSESSELKNHKISSGFQNNSQSQQITSSQHSFSQNSMGSYESRRVGYENVSHQSSQSIIRSEIAKTGVLGGISGDSNNLVMDEVDYQKHSVKDLAKHFAAVKPKSEIPINVLPEIKMYNGQGGPNVNYLGTQNNESKVTSSGTRKEVDQKELDASRLAYEEKKKKQVEVVHSSESSSSLSAKQTTETKSTKSLTSERRLSISSALMMDPAKQHAEAGLIDPSALLRGEGEGGVRKGGIIELAGIQGGTTEECANKWDNHNTIARGWADVAPNYQPVTFRNIYNVSSQRA